MPALTADQRIEYVRAVLETFCTQFKRRENLITNAEYELARRWALRGVPLATVLGGIVETTGKPRTLMACERSVEESIERWAKAVGSLTTLPAPGPLVDAEEPFDVEAARQRRDAALAEMRRG